MSFSPITDQAELAAIANKLDSLNKSFGAGFPGLQNAGRTGTSALAVDHLDSVLRSIAIEEEDFLLTKEIQQMPAKQSVYHYALKLSIGTSNDLWGVEGFLPQEDHGQYLRVAEVLKVQGIRKTITHMASLINEIDGYSVDLEAENDRNAALALAESLERALYVGGDYFMDSEGEIDGTVASQFNGPSRIIRGIQAQVREGNRSTRGIPQDFVAFGNNRSTVIDNRGAVLNRSVLDKVVSAVKDNRGRIVEAHTTVDQLRHFRATFFPVDRGNISESYTVRGANISSESRAGFPIQTVVGDIQMMPSVFKYVRSIPVPVQGSVGSAPGTPTISSTSQSSSNTGYSAGEEVKYVVQAVSVKGMSNASAPATVTIAADGNKVSLTIAAQAGVEEYMVFRTLPGEAVERARFIGKVIASRSGSTTFVDKQAILPGLDSVVFLPKQQYRAKLAVLGSLATKLTLGLKGLSSETVYVSYLASILEFVRHHALLDNVFSEID